MREVTEKEFFKEIEEKKLDVCPNPIGETSPYTSEFKFHSGKLWGKIVPSEVDKKKYPYPWYINHYYIME